METQWNAWLAAEKAAGRGGEVWSEPIVRGLAFEMLLPIPQDVSADTFEASVALAPGAAALEDFTVDVGDFENDLTLVTLTLSASQTAFAGAADGDLDGLAELVFDLVYTPLGGRAARSAALIIPVSEQVTVPA